MDLNQVMYSSLLVSIGKHTNIEIETPLLRHMVVNVIRANNMKFRSDYGELVLAVDSKNYWRKSYFPHYKASRKKYREKSELNWTAIFASMESIKADLRDHFPYKYVCVDRAEADDVIGTLCHKYGNYKLAGKPVNPILILSGDKDFKQLQDYTNVKQYDPVHKKWVKEDDPAGFLHEHILRGDLGDGIPNVASADNVFVVGERQKKMTQKLIDSLKSIEGKFDHPLQRNYQRNKTLIDLSKVPQDLQDQILEQFDKPVGHDRSHLMTYFIKNGMKKHLESLSDF